MQSVQTSEQRRLVLSCLGRWCAVLASGELPAGLIAVPSPRCARPETCTWGLSTPETHRFWQCPLAPPRLSSTACTGDTTAETPLHTVTYSPCGPATSNHWRAHLQGACFAVYPHNLCVIQHYGGTAGGPLAKHVPPSRWFCHNWVPFCC